MLFPDDPVAIVGTALIGAEIASGIAAPAVPATLGFVSGRAGNIASKASKTGGASRVAAASEKAVEKGADFVVSPGGTTVLIPKLSVGPSPTKTGKGFSYLGGSGGHGMDSRVSGVRIMDPTERYLNGYSVYMNKAGQTVNPFSGQTIGRKDPWAHVPLD